jgi:hypothetical protein
MVDGWFWPARIALPLLKLHLFDFFGKTGQPIPLVDGNSVNLNGYMRNTQVLVRA